MLFVDSGEITVKHKELGKLSLANVEVPQIDENLDLNTFAAELATFCGSEKGAKSYINEKIKTSARAIPSQAMRSLESGSDSVKKNADGSNGFTSEAETKFRDGAKNYSPRTGEGQAATAKKNAETVSQLQALVASGKPITNDDLMALLAASK